MKKVLNFLAVIIWPFLLVVCVIIWKQPQQKEKEALERKELLSDTARVNAAHRTYERIHKQQLEQDPYYQELARENDSLKRVIKENDY